MKRKKTLIIAGSLAWAGMVWAGGNHGTHWGYSGEAAPQHWAKLDTNFATCGAGKKQSPINISKTSKEKLPAIEVNYKDSPLNVVNNGHTIQVNYAPGSFIKVGGKKFDLLQFHFHSPSEHTVDGKPMDMVAHLVHKAADGQLGVVGVLMESGGNNATIAKVWANAPQSAGKKSSAETVNAKDLLPKSMAYYSYTGSLTTPPCSEGVKWMVLTTPAQVSAPQVSQFTKIFPKSVRPTQPVNNRVVKVSN